MPFVFPIGYVQLLARNEAEPGLACSCQQAKEACAPSFVFSITGQIRFRAALHHLAACPKRECRALRKRVLKGARKKLNWLFEEECLLGCVVVQPLLYGANKIVVQPHDFPATAHHLAHCPKESCAQLRRSLLLTIRNELHTFAKEESAA